LLTAILIYTCLSTTESCTALVDTGMDHGLFKGQSNDAPDDGYRRIMGGDKDTVFQLLISFSLGLSAILGFCVGRMEYIIGTSATV